MLIPKQNNTEVLKHANDTMHYLLEEQQEILFVVKQNKDEPHTFTIVSDRNYSDDDDDNDTNNGLEGVKLTFADPEDFRKHFPELIPVEREPIDARRIRDSDNKRKEYVPVKIRSIPPVDENNNLQYSANNVLSDDLDTIWAVKQVGAKLLLDYGKDIDIRTLWIAWARGDIRQFKFTVAVGKNAEVTKTSQKFQIIDHLQNVYSSGRTIALESYNLVKKKEDSPIAARYVVIQVNGNTMPSNREWAAISRIEVTSNLSVKSSETNKLIHNEKREKEKNE